MLLDLWQNVFKMALKDPQKNTAKKYQIHKVVGILKQFWRP